MADYLDKQSARQEIKDRLRDQRLARFPFPPHGRIPNFVGAAEAAKRLFDVGPWREAKRIKVNPDSPQRYVRIEALKRGIEVFVPTPRLRAGFKRLDQFHIVYHEIPAAAALSKGFKGAEDVALVDMP